MSTEELILPPSKEELTFQKQLDREMTSWNVHDALKGKTVPELNQLQPKLGYAVAAFNVEKGLNIGSMIRTSVCFGADEFFIIGKKKYDKRSTVGAQNYIKINKLAQDEFLFYLKENGYYPVFIETNGGNLVDHKARLAFLPGKACFVFGSESEGIPSEIINDNSFFPDKYVYRIQQFGVLRSLNVAVSLGIVLHSVYNEGY